MLKVRDATGVLRTVDSLKVRDATGVLRTIAFVRVRGPDSVLREVYSAAGGGDSGGTPAPSNPTYISPGSTSTASRVAASTAYFQAVSSGDAPTAYQWGVVDGPGTIVSGSTTANAQLRVNAIDGYGYAEFFCDITIGGAVYRATCTMEHRQTGLSGGGVQTQI